MGKYFHTKQLLAGFAAALVTWAALMSTVVLGSVNDLNPSIEQGYGLATSCTTDSECEALTGYPYDTAMSENPPKYPVLVGLGCEGTIGAPIYAFEEDHFPKCREIRAMDWEL